VRIKAKMITVLVLMCAVASAETAYRSMDGNLYLIRDSQGGPRFEKLTVIDLDGPNDPPKPPGDDKFGLIKVSRDEAAKIAAYPNLDEHRTKLSAFYASLADAVEAGTIPEDKLAAAVQITFLQAVGSDSAKWQPWKDATTAQFAASHIKTTAEAAQGLRDISTGLVEDSNRAIDWAAFAKFFIEVILPLIIKLIGTGG